MIIESARALKFHLMPFVLDRFFGNEPPSETIKVDAMEFLQYYCKTELLKRDEHSIYNGIIEKLDMGKKWSAE